jgi:hypothetical protein
LRAVSCNRHDLYAFLIPGSSNSNGFLTEINVILFLLT